MFGDKVGVEPWGSAFLVVVVVSHVAFSMLTSQRKGMQLFLQSYPEYLKPSKSNVLVLKC